MQKRIPFNAKSQRENGTQKTQKMQKDKEKSHKIFCVHLFPRCHLRTIFPMQDCENKI